MNESEYRVMRFYYPFFANYAYKLQRKVRVRMFLGLMKLKFWETVEVDHLGIRGYDWAEHFNCPIIDEETGEVLWSPKEEEQEEEEDG